MSEPSFMVKPMRALVLLLGAMLLLPAVSTAQDGDEEAKKIASQSGLWTLDFKHDHPRWISMNRDLGPDNEAEVYDKEGKGRSESAKELDASKIPSENSGSAHILRTENFFYVFYTVKNTTEKALPIFINVRAEDDKKNKYHDLYLPAVFNKVRLILETRGKVKKGEKLHAQQDLTIPTTPDDLNADPASRRISLPMIKPGETKKCVAIFRRLDPEMDKLKIHFHGLTNDVKVEANQAFQRTLKEKVRELEYTRLGSPHFTADYNPKFVGGRWIIVTKKIKTDLESP